MMKEIKIVLRTDRTDPVIVREHAATGCRGDGGLTVTAVDRIVGLRTGEEDLFAVV